MFWVLKRTVSMRWFFLSTNNICFGWEIRKINFDFTPLFVKLWMFSFSSVWTFVLGAQKNSLFEMVLLSTHNICFGWAIRKIIFDVTPLLRGLMVHVGWDFFNEYPQSMFTYYFYIQKIAFLIPHFSSATKLSAEKINRCNCLILYKITSFEGHFESKGGNSMKPGLLLSIQLALTATRLCLFLWNLFACFYQRDWFFCSKMIPFELFNMNDVTIRRIKCALIVRKK